MITDLLRKRILGKKERFVFEEYREGSVDFNSIGEEIGIYIHIPFAEVYVPIVPTTKSFIRRKRQRPIKML